MSDYPNSGILFPNRYKRAGTKSPDRNGTLKATCVHCQKETDYEALEWDHKRNKPFVTIKLTEKSEAERKRAEYKARQSGLPQDSQATPPATETTEGEPQKEEDDIPF